MAIRILRVIEYTYRDEETAAADQLRWTLNVNTGAMQMRSAVITAVNTGGPTDMQFPVARRSEP